MFSWDQGSQSFFYPPLLASSLHNKSQNVQNLSEKRAMRKCKQGTAWGVGGRCDGPCPCISFTLSFRLQSSEVRPGSRGKLVTTVQMQKARWCGNDGPALTSKQEGAAATPGWRLRPVLAGQSAGTASTSPNGRLVSFR